MKNPDSRIKNSPQEILRGIMGLCTNCDVCRTLLEGDCAFFPELYSLWDREKEQKIPITDAQLRNLTELCTLCGMCPCPRIPIQVIEAKTLFLDREGRPLATRLLADVPRMVKLAGRFPRLTKAILSSKAIGPMLRRITKFHPDRKLPTFPEQNFFQWARQNGLAERKAGGRTAVYFAGCTAAYIFPQVGRAVVEVLERSGVRVYVPPQQCCGMPHLAEGDRNTTLHLARSTMDGLLESVQAGDDLITSCPTCGYYMKVLLKERAHYSAAYKKIVEANEAASESPHSVEGFNKHKALEKIAYRKLLTDDGYFSPIDPLGRIKLAEHLFDVGEYLARLYSAGQMDTCFNVISKRVVYYAPCHQREQKIGRPYLELLRLIPGLAIEPVGSGMDCCGMGGNFGFKADFHDKSLAIGQPLMSKIRTKDPQAIVTDCLSCRLQFGHTLPYPVFHPIEILALASGV